MFEDRFSPLPYQRRLRMGDGINLGYLADTRALPEHSCNAAPRAASRNYGCGAHGRLVGIQRMVKAIFDAVRAFTAIIFTSPLLLGIIVAIKLTSRGPTIFKQRRYGLGSTEFEIYKFRTMYTHLGDRSGVTGTATDDPRITRVGRFLRRTSLDELPQLFNVIKGDMSLVGPRPHVPGMLAAGMPYEDLVPNYFERHAVRPGITGLAQVNGFRGSTAEAHAGRGRIALDLTYISNWSLLLDAQIIVATMVHEFLSGSGD